MYWEFNRLILKDILLGERQVQLPGLAGAMKVAQAEGFNNGKGFRETKKSGLKVATLISTPNPVSQVLW
jgi:hypothetical protein